MENRVDRIRSHYEPRIERYSEGHMILDWEDRESQRARFETLCAAVELEGRSLLDVGCGVGDLAGYLNERGLSVTYTGVDILSKMIRIARRMHPERTFVCADLTSDNPFSPNSFHTVFCSGVFNLGGAGEHEFVRTLIGILKKIARRHLVFNMLDASAPAPDPAYTYYDPDDVVGWDELRGTRARVIKGYLPNDFTVVCDIGSDIGGELGGQK